MQKIVIDNFRQISHAEIEVKDFLLLIGEQASGKSTIAKLIYFFKSLKRDFCDVVSQPNGKVREELIHKIQDKFAMYFGYTSKINKEMNIVYYYDVNSNAYLQLGKKNSLYIKFEDNFWSKIVQNGNELQRILKGNSHMQMGARFVSQKMDESLKSRLEATTNKLFYDAKECIFLPAGRNITVSYPEQFQLLFFGEIYPSITMREVNTIDVNLIKTFVSYSKFLVDYFSSFHEEDSSFEEAINDIVHQILHGDYKNENGLERIEFGETDSVRLNIASSGQQESIRLIQDAIYIYKENLPASRIIEEPEAHLFPSAQKILIELLLLIANKTHSQIIITTHSPHVLSVFNNMLYCTKVLSSHPELKNEIMHRYFNLKNNILADEFANINPSKFQSYSLSVNKENYCTSIFDSETQLIGDNLLDEAAEKINEDFDYLYALI